MKKLIFLLFITMCSIFAQAQDVDTYEIRARQSLKADKNITIGSDVLNSTTQVSTDDTVFVTRDYLNLFNSDGLLSGGYVTWTGDLDFTVSPAAYCIGGELYTTATTSISLSASDATYDRIDVIAVDDTGVVTVIEGIASANPQKPSVDPASQVELTHVLIQAGATTPSNPGTGTMVTSEMVYDENVEWTASAKMSLGSVNFSSTASPYGGLISADVNIARGGDELKFTSSEEIIVENVTGLSLMLKLKATFSTQYALYVYFMHGASTVGFRKLDINTSTTNWQSVGVATSTISMGGLVFDSVVLRFYKRGFSNAPVSGFYIDKVQLQGNFTQANTGAGADITGNETIFDGWDKDVTDDFSGDYNDLTNKPTTVSTFTNDAGYLTSFTETDPVFEAWDKDYADLINTPTIPTDDQTAAEVSVTVQNGIEQNNVQLELEAIREDMATGGDGWGTDVVNHDATLSGNGTSGDPLGVNSITSSRISDFDTEVSNNTSVTANTAKVTNATHTGEVTGSTALTVSSSVIDYDNVATDLKGSITDNDLAWDYDAAGIVYSSITGGGTIALTNGQINKTLLVVLTVSSFTSITIPAEIHVLGGTIEADGTYYLYLHCIGTNNYTLSIQTEQ